MKKVKLKDVAIITMGQAPPGESYNDKGIGLPLIAGAGDFGERFPKPVKHTDEVKKVSKKNDIIMCVRATVGDLNWADKEYALGRGVASLRVRECINRDYLWYWLIANKGYFVYIGKGVTFIQITKSDIEDALIPLPPLDIQKKIATVLDKADSLRQKRREAIEKLDKLVQSVFLDMFGDPVSNPKGWTLIPLGKIGNVQGGLQVTTKREKNPIELPYLRVANVYRDRLELNEIKTIRVTEDEKKRIALKTGDILIVEGHGNKNEIGRSAVWNGSINPCLHQNHIIRVRIDEQIAKTKYISFYLNSLGGRKQMLFYGKTTSGLNPKSTI